jgi:hypothetical protein
MARRAGLGAIAAVLAMVLTAGMVLAASFVGNASPNTIVGTADSDVIEGRGGGDALHGQGSVDAVYGGDGDDLIRGGPGGDHPGFDIGPLVPGLYGGFGDDRVEGNGGGDLIVGGAGADLSSAGEATTRSGTPGRARWTTSVAATGRTSWRPARAIGWPQTARGWSAPSATDEGVGTFAPWPLLPFSSNLVGG